MKRKTALAAALAAYQPADAAESAHRDEILAFVLGHDHPFDRAHLHGHLTGSAIVVDAAGERTLLGFHRKLSRWLQPGGHGESGELRGEDVALREAREESGIAGLALHPGIPGPLDVDVHVIPARGTVPEHKHLDLRYLLVAPAGAEPVHRDEEHHDMRWFAWDEASALSLDAPLLRALAKARDWMQRT
jgi:8-oxo-dGTP pyrophosphatase MutT (NUDIX family)